MTPDPSLVEAIKAILKNEDSPEWREVLIQLRVACRLSEPMCGPEDPRIYGVLQRAAHWHQKALLLEQAIRESLGQQTGHVNHGTNRISS